MQEIALYLALLSELSNEDFCHVVGKAIEARGREGIVLVIEDGGPIHSATVGCVGEIEDETLFETMMRMSLQVLPGREVGRRRA